MDQSGLLKRADLRPLRVSRWLQQLVARIHSTLASYAPSTTCAVALHDLLRLDVVAEAGRTPAAYCWEVDPLLRVRLYPSSKDQVGALIYEQPPRGNEPPEKGARAGVYRAPRQRRSMPPLQAARGRA